MPKRLRWLVAGCLTITACHSNVEEKAVFKQPSRPIADVTTYGLHDFDTLALLPTRLPVYGIKLGMPANWNAKTSPNYWSCSKTCVPAAQAPFCANFVVNSIARRPSIPLTVYADTLISRTQHRSNVKAFRLIDAVPQKLNGLSLLIVDYKMLVDKSHLGGIFVLIELPEKLVVITFLGPNNPAKSYIRYRGLYERVIQSIKPI